MKRKSEALKSAKHKNYLDVFIKTSQFGEFRWEREFSEFCIRNFVPELKLKYLEVKEKYKFKGKSLTLRKWLDICIAEGITVLTDEQLPDDVTGGIGGCYGLAKDGTKFIWIRGTLSMKEALPVAAHELAHHFLGHSHVKIPSVVLDETKTLLESYLEQPELLAGELQAEILAAMLLTKSLED
jgi:hypothetical protein